MDDVTTPVCSCLEGNSCAGMSKCDVPDCPMQYAMHQALVDGGQSVSLSASPLVTQDVDSQWIPIDTTIDPTTMSPRATSYGVKFLPKITTPGAVTYTSKQGNAQFYLKGWGFPDHPMVEESSDGVISDSTITYTLSFGKIVYECTSDGVKETIYLENNRVLPDPTTLGLSLEGLNLEFDFDLPPVEFETALTVDNPTRKNMGGVTRTGTGLSLDYAKFVSGPLPIVIDPSLTTTSANAGASYFHHNDLYNYNDSNCGVSQSTNYFGTASTVDDGMDYYDEYWWHRTFYRFDLSAYTGHTIYEGGTACRLLQTAIIGSCSGYPIANEIADWGTTATFANTYSAPSLYALGTAPGLSNSPYPNSLKNRLILSKMGVSKKIAFLVKGTEVVGYADDYAGTIAGTGGGTLNFTSYSTFTQTAPTAGVGQVTVNWTNGGGLVAGDYHHIYWAIGSGLTATAIKAAGNTPVQSSGYNATSAVVTGLTGGTAYSFYVADAQLVNSTLYDGAVSTVQTATPTGGGGPVVLGTYTVNVDSRRKVAKAYTMSTDTRRKLVKTQTTNTDTSRKVAKSLTIFSDTRRKVTNAVSLSIDTRRRVSKVITTANDTRRRIQKQINTSTDTRRKVVATASASVSTRRKVFVVSSALVDTVRKVKAIVTTLTDTRRKVGNIVEIKVATRRNVLKVITVSADVLRNVVSFVTTKVDTQRTISAWVEVLVDAQRKVSQRLIILVDTARVLVTGIGSRRTAPYMFQEAPETYLMVGTPEQYIMK